MKKKNKLEDLNLKAKTSINEENMTVDDNSTSKDKLSKTAIGIIVGVVFIILIVIGLVIKTCAVPKTKDVHVDSTGTTTVETEVTTEATTPATTTAVTTTAKSAVTTTKAPEVTKPAPTPAPEYTVTPMSATMYTKSSANARTGPTTSYAKSVTLGSGTTVTVTGKASTGWYQISYNGKTLFVSDTLLTSTKPASKVTAPKDYGTKDETVKPSSGGSSDSGNSKELDDWNKQFDSPHAPDDGQDWSGVKFH